MKKTKPTCLEDLVCCEEIYNMIADALIRVEKDGTLKPMVNSNQGGTQ